MTLAEGEDVVLKPCDEDIIWYLVTLPPYIRAIVVYNEICSVIISNIMLLQCSLLVAALLAVHIPFEAVALYVRRLRPNCIFQR